MYEYLSNEYVSDFQDKIEKLKLKAEEIKSDALRQVVKETQRELNLAIHDKSSISQTLVDNGYALVTNLLKTSQF